MNPASNNQRFWSFLETDATTRGADFRKYASATATGPIAKINPELLAKMPDLCEPSQSLAQVDNSTALDFARRANWHFCGATVTVSSEPKTPTQDAISKAHLREHILETEELASGRPTLPQKNFSNQDELRDLLAKRENLEPYVPALRSSQSNVSHGSNAPNAQTVHESMQPADPRKPAAHRMVELLQQIKQRNPQAWAQMMDRADLDRSTEPTEFVENCRAQIKIAAIADMAAAAEDEEEN
jgi:hypothetical protein